MAHQPAGLYRRNVGIAVFNRAGLVLVAERAGMAGAWQMPQGGLDEGEDPWEGAKRELQEEIGTANVTYLGETDRWLRYEFPPHQKSVFKGRYVGQEQKWFAARFTGQEDEIDLSTTDHAEFTAWRWVPLAGITEMIVDFKRPIYEEIVRDFSQFTNTVD